MPDFQFKIFSLYDDSVMSIVTDHTILIDYKRNDRTYLIEPIKEGGKG